MSGSRSVALQYFALAEEAHAALGLFMLAYLLPLAFEAVIQGQTDLHTSRSPSHHTNLHAAQFELNQTLVCSLDCVGEVLAAHAPPHAPICLVPTYA